jgi:hypothetical protein
MNWTGGAYRRIGHRKVPKLQLRVQATGGAGFLEGRGAGWMGSPAQPFAASHLAVDREVEGGPDQRCSDRRRSHRGVRGQDRRTGAQGRPSDDGDRRLLGAAASS